MKIHNNKTTFVSPEGYYFHDSKKIFVEIFFSYDLNHDFSVGPRIFMPPPLPNHPTTFGIG